MSHEIYLALDEEDYPLGAFTTREAAAQSFPDGDVKSFTLHDAAIPPWKYWHRGASVYPDGTYEEWTQEHIGRGECWMQACDDHLNTDRVWDGHTQSHCGEHISIFGTDRERVEEAFTNHLAAAIARQNGRCQSAYHHGETDGVNTYMAGFMVPPRKRRSR